MTPCPPRKSPRPAAGSRRRHAVRRADEPDDESVARRRPPRAGVDDVLTAEVLDQMQLRGGYSRSELARRIGWNVHSAGRLLNSKGPRQSWTVAELDDVAKRGFGCSLSSLLVGAGIDHAEVDLVDAVYSDDRLSRGAKEAIVFLIRKDRGGGRCVRVSRRHLEDGGSRPTVLRDGCELFFDGLRLAHANRVSVRAVLDQEVQVPVVVIVRELHRAPAADNPTARGFGHCGCSCGRRAINTVDHAP